MNTMKNKIIVGLLLIALVLGVYSTFIKKSEVITQSSDGEKVVVGGSGPYKSEDFISFQGGFEPTFRTQGIQTATSTLCAIPITATSTLAGFHVMQTVVDATGGTWVLATSSTAFATTTPLFGGTLLASTNTLISVMATTSGTTATDKILKPGQYLVFDVAGKLTYTTRGKCYAELRVFK